MTEPDDEDIGEELTTEASSGPLEPTKLYIGQTGSVFAFSARSKRTLDAHYYERIAYLRSHVGQEDSYHA